MFHHCLLRSCSTSPTPNRCWCCCIVEVSMRVQHVLITPVTWGQSRKLRFSKIDSRVKKTSQATQTTSHNIHYRDKRWAKKLCYSNVESLGFDWHPVLIGVEGSEQTAHVGQVSSVSTTLRKICLSKNYSKNNWIWPSKSRKIVLL